MIRFEWHEAKKRSNKKKHGIDCETAQLVFDDPHCISFVERVSDGEERWIAIGSIEKIIVIVVVHAYREETSDEVIRIISARHATRHERNLYAQAKGSKTEKD
jgi:uncharacterized DUF497 family protein